MRRTRAPMPLVAVATCLFLAVAPSSSPSGSASLLTAPEPNLDEIVLLEEVADWLAGVGARQPTLAAAVRARPESFEVFRRYNGSEERRRVVERVPFGTAIHRAAQEHGVDALLLAAVVEVESSFNPRVVSSQGAVGLAQVMPDTARVEAEALLDPRFNLGIGARYLRGLLDRFDGDLVLALAAYNAGPGAVERYGGVPPFRETRAFVEKVLARYVDHHQAVWQSADAVDLLMMKRREPAPRSAPPAGEAAS